MLKPGLVAASGANNVGAVIKLTPKGVETVPHSFAGGADGTRGGDAFACSRARASSVASWATHFFAVWSQ